MNRMIKAVLCTVVAVLSVACGGGGGGASPTPAPTSDPPPPAPVQFTDVTASSGIAYQAGYANPFGDSGSTLMTILALQDFATSSVASGDYDGDGDVDLFITRGDIGPNLLYRNDGNLVFTDVAAAAGVDHTKSATENYRHSGPAFGDMDGDGDLDLFVGGLFGDPSLIFENNGNGTELAETGRNQRMEN